MHGSGGGQGMPRDSKVCIHFFFGVWASLKGDKVWQLICIGVPIQDNGQKTAQGEAPPVKITPKTKLNV
jgi:hypothetical protein